MKKFPAQFLLLLIVLLPMLRANAEYGKIQKNNLEIAEKYFDKNSTNSALPQVEVMLIKPYNIFETKPFPVCPEGYILAHRHCHKRVKSGE